MKIVIGFIVLVCAIAFGGILYHQHRQKHLTPAAIASHIEIDGTVLPTPRVIHPFQLRDTQNKPFSNANLKGHWTLIFFGFTNCGYVCPTTFSELAKTYKTLQAQLPASLLPQVVMVSVDPDRDTINRLKDYVHAFNPAFIGLRGKIDATKNLADQMSAVFAKVNMPNNNYTVTHSAEIMLLDPNGNLRAFLSYPHTSDRMTHDYESVVQAYTKVEYP